MQPYQQRVIEERNELQRRIEKLAAFLNSNAYSEVSNEEAHLLGMQLDSMRTYKNILDERIDLLVP